MSKGNPKVSGSGFITFSSLSSSNSNSNSTNNITTNSTSPSQTLGTISPIYTGNDNDLSVACRKLLKKDSITKLKAIHEVLVVINNENQRYINIVDDVLNDFLPFFMYIYMRLVFDNDRKIREKINFLLHSIIKIDKRLLAPYMKILIGPWWLSVADPFTEVSKLSLDSFYLAILPKKRQSVLSYLSSSLFEYVFKNLDHTVETLSDLSQCTREEAEERYERVMVSSLECIKVYVETLNDEENLKLIQLDSVLYNNNNNNNNNEICKGYKSIINEKLWKKAMHKNDSIRKGTYKLLSTTFTKLPSLYETNFNWQRLSNIIINIFDESNPSNLVEMYNLILISFSHHIVALEIWKYIDIPVDIIPKLTKNLTNYRNITLQYITSLIGLFPFDEVSISSVYLKKTKIKNMKKNESIISNSTVLAIINLVDSLFTNKSVDQFDLFLLERQCIIEICTLLLLRKCDVVVDNSNGENNTIDIAINLMQNYVLNSLNDIISTIYNHTVSSSVLDSIKRCLVQLYRGSLKERNFIYVQWKSLFWDLFLNNSLFYINNFVVPKNSVDEIIYEKVSNYLIIMEYLYTIYYEFHSEHDKENIGLNNIAIEMIEKHTSAMANIISQKLVICNNDCTQAIDLIELTTMIRSLLIYRKSSSVMLLQLHSGDWIYFISKWLFTNIDTSDDTSSLLFRFIMDQIKSILLCYLPIINETIMNTLLSKIVNGKSVLCLNLLISCYRATNNTTELRVSSDCTKIFLNTCKSFILNNEIDESDLLVSKHIKDKILFIVQFVLQFHSSSIIIDEIIALLMCEDSFISNCVILSLYLAHLNRRVGLNIVNESIVIPASITSDEIYIRKIMISVMLTNNSKSLFEDSDENELICSWYDLRVKLIPLLDASAIYSFMLDAIDQLTILFNDQTNYQILFARNWCQYVIELIHLSNDKNVAILNKLPIFSCNYWKLRNKCNILCNNFQCVDDLYRQRNNKSIFCAIPVSLNIDLYWEILDSNLDNHDTICNSLVLNILNEVSDLVYEEKVIMLNTLVTSYETIYSVKNSTENTNKIFISFLESLISSEKLKVSSINNNNCFDKLVLDPILSTDIISRGQELYYVNFSIHEVEPAALLETHRETGIEPFYTIKLLVSDKEIQTERHKLLVSRPTSFVLNNVYDKELSICDLLCKWIKTVLFPMFNDIRKEDIREDTLIDILCQLYNIIANSCRDSLIIRYICSMYKDLLMDIFGKVESNIINVNYGLKLLREILSNNINSNDILYKILIGNGIWLLPIFQSLKSISVNVISAKSTDDDDLLLTVNIFNVMTMFVENFQMRECHQHLLSCIQYIVFMDGRCNKSVLNLLQNCLFNCCKIYWNERNILSSNTRVEHKNNPFLINYHGTEFSNIEVSALSVIFNAFINDGVENIYKNNAALAILSCFYSKDIHLSNGILNKISVDKDYVNIECKLISIISNTVNYCKIVLAAIKLLEIVTSLAVSPFFVDVVNNCNTFINNELEKDVSNEDLIDAIQDDVDLIENENNKMLLDIVGNNILISEISEKIDVISTNFDQEFINKSIVSLLLLWIILLQKIDTCSTVSGLSSIRSRCGIYLHHNSMLQKILHIILKYSKDFLQFKSLVKSYNVIFTANNSDKFDFDDNSIQCIINYSLYRTICTFPAMIRTWWSNDCNRLEKQKISKFIETTLRKPLLNRELLIIENAFLHKLWDPSVFTIKGSNISGELCASLVIEDGPKVELSIKVPTTYPLNNVEVEITKIGIAENRVRRWILQIIQLLSMQDGTVLDALLMWKKNVEKELDGIEPCPICYSILHPKTMSLPKLKCPTCNNKFHNQCLYTWFKSSGKSKCVICQQPMYN